MGTLKINGKDMFDFTTALPKDDIRTKHSVFGSKIKGLKTSIDNGSEKIVTGLYTESYLGEYIKYHNANKDALQNKLRVNGIISPVMVDGTRPRNVKATSFTGVGATKYINNIDGVLYLADKPNEVSGVIITTSHSTTKECIVNIAAWGSGGKGGGGAYWFLAGNWGGVGGAGGGKIFFTDSIYNNDYIKIVTDSDGDKGGRISESSNYTIESPGLSIYNSYGSRFCHCTGGYSGTSNNPRWSTDNYNGAGTVSLRGDGDHVVAALPPWNVSLSAFRVRKISSGVAKKVWNGSNGTSNTFSDSEYAPYLGNPENDQGELVLTGSGGAAIGGGQVHGSAGSGGYGNGGNAGDTGNGSNGASGSNGGGGGGAGSPAGGASGGNGGLPGFIIFY